MEGLLIALDNIDEVINIIRSSANTPEAKNRLIERFSLTDVQAQAIVDMRLRALTGLEREKLEKDVAKLDKKLSNPGYLAKAKPEIVEKDKAKRAEFAAKLELVAQQIAEL